MKSTRKSLLLVVCAILLTVAVTMGTLAYLTESTAKVTNTFVVGSIFDPEDPDPHDDPEGDDDTAFVLYEHAYDDLDKDGVYTIRNGAATDEELEAVRVKENAYTVIPGVNVPKDPFVRTDKKLNMAAYCFIEVVDTNTTGLTATVDQNIWAPLKSGSTQLTGQNNGKIYFLKALSSASTAKSKVVATFADESMTAAKAIDAQGKIAAGTTFTADILANNEVVVATDLASGTSLKNIEFYGYLVQAGNFQTAVEAWNASGFKK